jgi:hypothetical protein
MNVTGRIPLPEALSPRAGLLESHATPLGDECVYGLQAGIWVAGLPGPTFRHGISRERAKTVEKAERAYRG